MFKKIIMVAVSLLLMIPVFALAAIAATEADFNSFTVKDLGIEVTNASGSGDPTCTWYANGDAITGSLVGGKDSSGLFKYYYEASSTLTFTNNKSTEAQLSFKYTVTTSGSAYGDVTVNGTKFDSSVTTPQECVATLPAGGTLTVVLHVPQRKQMLSLPTANGAEINISEIKLVADSATTVTFGEAENGSYTAQKADGTAITVPGAVAVQSTDKLTMTATPAEGYVFAGWYKTVDGVTTALSANLTYSSLFEEATTVFPKFMLASDALYSVGTTMFANLTDAAAAAAYSSVKTVVLLKDTTLTEDATIPMGVTLLIPYNAEHSLNLADPDTVTISWGTSNPYVAPTAFRTLTMADGVTLTVNGALSVNARHESCVGGQIYGGQVYLKYGEIKMQGNSKITLNRGAALYAWGYIWGEGGTVEAMSGATIYEKMQVTDYCGGTNLTKITLSKSAFPFNQYYIQNVEVEEILHQGAILMAHLAFALTEGDPSETAVEFIGSSSAMFSVSGATITKEYHPETDRLSLTVNGDANSVLELNGMNIVMDTLKIESSDYAHPINSNIDININAGTAIVNQRMVLQPGVRVNVATGANLKLNANVYVIDLDEWGPYVFANKTCQPIIYTPSLGGRSTRTVNSDAVIDLNGHALAIAGLYTTAGGSTIISSKGTGVIEFSSAAPSDSTVSQITGSAEIVKINVTSVKLKNGGENGSTFVATKGAAKGTIYRNCAACGFWYAGDHTDVVESTWKIVDDKVYADGKLVPAYQLVIVDGKTYFIGDYNKIVKNRAVYVDGAWLPFGADGALTTEKIVLAANSTTYYAFENGARSTTLYGLFETADATYFVADGYRVAMNKEVWVNGTYWYFDANGKKAEEGTTLIFNDRVYVSGEWLRAYAVVDIEGNFYKISDYHKIAKNTTIYINDPMVGPRGYYNVGADGVVEVNN